MPELPPWADTVRLRHLISDTSGLPEGVEFDDLHRAKLDRTTAGVIHAGDELGVSALLHTPGHLDDGTPLGYAWALDVREHAGQRIYRHGGRWVGLGAQLVRLADQRAGFVVIALDDDEERMATLADAMIEELTHSA